MGESETRTCSFKLHRCGQSVELSEFVMGEAGAERPMTESEIVGLVSEVFREEEAS